MTKKPRLNTIMTLFFIVIPFLICAQKEDRNWVFGYNCGIDFNNSSNPQVFQTISNTCENATSISDSVGNLLIYLGNVKGMTYVMNLYNGNNVIIPGGNNINTDANFANGSIIIPRPEHLNQYYVFYTGWNSSNGYFKLNVSIVEIHTGANGIVLTKDSTVISDPMEEGIDCVKHANGKDWWLVMHKSINDTAGSYSNCFYRLLITSDGISGPYSQNIGTPHHHIPSYALGIPRFSKSGNLFANTAGYNGIIDLFDFDRCTGLLSNYRIVDCDTFPLPYCLEFSPKENCLYVSNQINYSTTIFLVNKLYQYDISSNIPPFTKTLIWNDSALTDYNHMIGQFRIGPDERIYLAYGCAACGSNYIPPADSINKNLCVINQPNSLGTACDFQPWSFYLGDSAISEVNLPNIPNYFLPPLSIYIADAGTNDTICTNDSISQGVYIGVPMLPHVQYSWWPSTGLDSVNIAMPYANPSQTTTYYLSLSDTNIEHSCQSRIDSVIVTVMDCSASINEYEKSIIKVYPNPATDKITIITPDKASIEFSNINGQIIKSILSNSESTTIDMIDFSSGVYIVRVKTDKEIVTKKIIKE